MSLLDHDLVLTSLARERIDSALEEAARERLVRAVRRPRERAAAVGADGAPPLTPARLETR
jgi:hypothetical protein